MVRTVFVGLLTGVILALSAVWFWTNLPGRDLLQLFAAVSDPVILSAYDPVYILLPTGLFLVSLFITIANVSMFFDNRSADIVNMLAVGFGVGFGAIFATVFQQPDTSPLVLGVIGSVIGLFVIFFGFYLYVQVLNISNFSGREFQAIARTELVASVGTLLLLWIIGMITGSTGSPNTRANQIAQLQTHVAATATAAPQQTAAAVVEREEMTQLAILAATLNQPTPTAAATEARPLNLLPNQLATLMAQPASSQVVNEPSPGISFDQIVDVAGLLASIVTVVGGLYAGYRVLRGRK